MQLIAMNPLTVLLIIHYVNYQVIIGYVTKGQWKSGASKVAKLFELWGSRYALHNKPDNN